MHQGNLLAEPPPSLGFRIEHNALGQPVVVWTGAVDVSADELVLRPRIPYAEAVDQAKHFLQELLAPGPCSWQEVHQKAHAAGISERTLRRAKDQLGVLSEEQRPHGRSQWYWSLPNSADRAVPVPWGEQRALALKKAEEESHRFLEELRERHKAPSPEKKWP